MWNYDTSVEWQGGEKAALSCPGKPDIDITPPPEFGGQPDKWSPEDLLVGSIESCTLLTFLFFVDKMKIGLKAYSSKASASLERTGNGLRFQTMSITISATVASAEDEEKVHKAAEQAEKYCPVSAAVNVPITMNVESTVAS